MTGPVLNAPNFGGYLIHEGVPVFTDTRADLYGEAFLRRYNRAVSVSEPDALTDLMNSYHVTWTIFEPGTPAIALLDRLPGWHRVYADDVAVVHARAVTP